MSKILSIFAVAYASVALLGGMSAFAADLEIQEVDLRTHPEMEFALRSEAFRLKPDSGMTEADIAAAADQAYAARCFSEKNRAQVSASFTIHSSPIPELDQIQGGMADRLVSSAECSPPTQSKSAVGFYQSSGLFKVKFDTQSVESLARIEEADRRFYRIRLPIQARGSWGSVEATQQLYHNACGQLRANLNQNAVLFTFCSEPTVEIKCCGNVDFAGEFQAIVFAYSDNGVEKAVHTGKTPRAVSALTASHLAARESTLGQDYALGVCTQPSWEYMPVMAYQSECFVLRQTYLPKWKDALRCRAEVGQGSTKAEYWVSYGKRAGTPYLRYDAKTSRFQSSDERAAKVTRISAVGGGDTVEVSTVVAGASEGIVVELGAIDPANPVTGSFAATIRGLDSVVRGAPALTSATCGFLP